MKKRAKRTQKNDMLPVIIIGVGALLVVIVLLLQIIQSPNPTTAGQDIPEPGIERVSLANSKAAFDEKSAMFLDVRDSGSFEASHIPGAVNIPFALLETRINELDPNQWIITYCT
jgi:3-mercaptopyruvate sulfurtransferase SseA